MASKEPPLIRSSKAFSVDIPEGSNSAKARRSDITAGLAQDLAFKDPHFEASSQLSTDSGHVLEDHSQATSSSFSHDEAHEDRFAGGQTDADHAASLDVPADHHGHPSTGSMEEKHALHDHSVGVANAALEDHFAAVPQDNVNDSHAVLPDEAIEDHFAAVPQDNVNDSHAVLPDEAIEDHHISVEEPVPQAPIPLFVSADDDFPDDHMEIDYPPEVDPNAQPLEDEAVVDHVVHLPDGGHGLADAQLAHSQAPPAETVTTKPAAQPIPVLAKPTSLLTPEMAIKKHEEDMAARKLRMEEFHGRVDAIRQTVSSINAKLDQIAPHEGKPPGH